MVIRTSFICILVVVFPCLISSIYAADCHPMCKVFKPYTCSDPALFNASSFGSDFYFGGASSAYQVEGAAGRGPNIWDSFTHRYADMPNMTLDNGDLGTDSYHLYKDDVQTLVRLGANAYRFSIAWSRLMQKGRRSSELFNNGINLQGVAYYNNLINELRKYGIQPFVTLFHWDLPQYLEDDYGGFVKRKIVTDYVSYADYCFKTFGDRVKNWITLNQPYSYAYKGYGDGTYPPHRCSSWMVAEGCVGGDSGTEPYLAAHHQILAHAYAVKLYRENYKTAQGGQIGTTLITRWFVPYNNTPANINATERAFDFFLGWFLGPMTTGDYPQVMKDMVGSRLPRFTLEESNVVRNSLDFLGINYYVAQYVIDGPVPDPAKPSVTTDARTIYTYIGPDGNPIGEQGFQAYAYPPGIKNILEYVKVKYFDRYGKKPVYITENGYKSNGTVPLGEILTDQDRIEYHCSHLACLKCAIENDSNLEVKGYFAWSNLDNYEFLDGFSVRFGMNYVDFNNVTDRRPKESGVWFGNFNRARGGPKLLRASI